jgi:hypothetical protein
MYIFFVLRVSWSMYRPRKARKTLTKQLPKTILKNHNTHIYIYIYIYIYIDQGRAFAPKLLHGVTNGLTSVYSQTKPKLNRYRKSLRTSSTSTQTIHAEHHKGKCEPYTQNHVQHISKPYAKYTRHDMTGISKPYAKNRKHKNHIKHISKPY